MKIYSYLLAMMTITIAVFCAAPASAQATRTWVSGVGDDANPCSRTAPCKTFAGAISKTAAGGEINCIDPGGFGGVTITKSIAIKCDNVSAGATDVVFLSGLDFEGVGTGLSGIVFNTGAALHVQNSIIRGFSGGSAGNGILFQPSAAAELYVSDTVVADNVGTGIEIKPTGTGSALVSLARVRAENNTTGIRGNGTGGTGAINISIVDSVSSGNTGAGINATTPASGQTTQITIDRSASSNNASFGIRADGAGATVRFGNSVFSGNQNVNGTVTAVNSATLGSYGNNLINGNVADAPFPPTISLH
jgi:hypothetical protein